jgi:uncharacterized protein YbaR (Trm112 family)
MADEPTDDVRSPDVAPYPVPSVVDPRLLEFLVCPLTKTALSWAPQRGELLSRAARLAFPVRDGVPLLAIEAARALGDDEV